MRLNLGCGNKKVEGFIGVDIKDADITSDIRKLPFCDGEIDEIMAIHVCEHLFINEIVFVVREWLRVLKPGGTMALELPCFDKVAAAIVRNESRNPDIDRQILSALYGQPKTHKDGDPAIHKWCWSRVDFVKMLELAGAKNIHEEEPLYHVKDRDMRFVCTK